MCRSESVCRCGWHGRSAVTSFQCLHRRKKLRQRSEAVLETFAALSCSSTRAAAFLSAYRPPRPPTVERVPVAVPETTPTERKLCNNTRSTATRWFCRRRWHPTAEEDKPTLHEEVTRHRDTPESPQLEAFLKRLPPWSASAASWSSTALRSLESCRWGPTAFPEPLSQRKTGTQLKCRSHILPRKH